MAAKERRNWLNSLKSAPCMDCGGVFPPECMDFDHVRGVKFFNISNICRSMESLLHEIAKCDLVCANCHRIRTAKRPKLKKLERKLLKAQRRHAHTLVKLLED